MKIVCTSDKKYMPLLRALVTSVATNSPQTSIYARLVSWEEKITDEEIADLKNIHPLVEIERDDGTGLEAETFEKAPNLVENFLKSREKNRPHHHRRSERKSAFKTYQTIYTDAAAYCTNIKFNTLNKLAKACKEPLLYLDVDTVVRKDLSDLEAIIENTDIAIVNDTPTLIDFKQGGLIGFNPNALRARVYMLEVESQLDLFNITGDEIAMKAVYDQVVARHWRAARMDLALQVEALSCIYKDEGKNGSFDSESVMWSGHGDIKSYSEAYISEQRKYENSSDNTS